MAKVLAYISQNGDVNVTNQYGYTAAHVAAFHGHSDLLRVLKQNNADFDVQLPPTGLGVKSGATPLHLACMENEINCVDFLLVHGANPYIINAEGKTPRAYCNDEVKSLFVEYENRRKVAFLMGAFDKFALGQPVHTFLNHTRFDPSVLDLIFRYAFGDPDAGK